MANQPYVDITGTTSYRIATGTGTNADPYIPGFGIQVLAKSAWLSTATITRAANTTPYTANDVYGTVFELTNIGSSGGFIKLSSIDIMFNISALPSGMGSLGVFLYNTSPASAFADNAAFSVPSGDRASIITLNHIPLNAALAVGGGSVVTESVDVNRLVKLATGSTSLWGYLVTFGAFTPAANSETATIRARSEAP